MNILLNLERLIWNPTVATDLYHRYDQVRYWFSGQSFYDGKSSTYPPASQLILWPLLGWLPFQKVRWIWAILISLAMAWLINIAIKASHCQSKHDRLLVALLLFSMAASGVAIRGGQLILVLLPLLVSAILCFKREGSYLSTDITATALVIVSLVKPSVTAPFLTLICFLPGKWRPIILVISGYLALSLLALSFQQTSIGTQVSGWGGEVAAAGAGRGQGYNNLRMWMATIGLKEYSHALSFMCIIVLGFWVKRYRQCDVWILLGVVAIFARFWTYHRIYDNVLLFLPAISLFKIVNENRTHSHTRLLASSLLAMNTIVMLIPLSIISKNAPWGSISKTAQALTWLGILIFLVKQAHQSECTEKPPLAL